jgi:hypothetical protein
MLLVGTILQRYKDLLHIFIYIMELSEGSLRSSHREINPVRLKYAPKPLQVSARNLVDSICKHGGPIIRQRLDMENMKQPLQKGVFYVAENEGKSQPGFLVFLPGKQAVVYLQTKERSPPPAMLRMRVSPYISERGGSVFVANLDTIAHTLRIEDVWMWRGEPLFTTTPYSQRRDLLQEFVEQHWIPDARLMGGITTTILNPISLAELCTKSLIGTSTIDLIPEQPGKRRLWYMVDAVVKPVAEPVAKPVAEPKHSLKGLAFKVDNIPDIYDIYDEKKTLICRASVQFFALSQEMRSKCSTDEGVWVNISWRDDFKGYEIIKML